MSEVSARSDRSSLRVGKKAEPRPTKKEERRGRAAKKKEEEREKRERRERERRGRRRVEEDTRSELSYGQPDTDLSRTKTAKKAFSEWSIFDQKYANLVILLFHFLVDLSLRGIFVNMSACAIGLCL